MHPNPLSAHGCSLLWMTALLGIVGFGSVESVANASEPKTASRDTETLRATRATDNPCFPLVEFCHRVDPRDVPKSKVSAALSKQEEHEEQEEKARQQKEQDWEEAQTFFFTMARKIVPSTIGLAVAAIAISEDQKNPQMGYSNGWATFGATTGAIAGGIAGVALGTIYWRSTWDWTGRGTVGEAIGRLWWVLAPFVVGAVVGGIGGGYAARYHGTSRTAGLAATGALMSVSVFYLSFDFD